MLKKINEGGVEGKDFLIQITGPETLIYKSKNNTIELDIGYDPTKRIVYIYASDITSLNEIEKDKMINDIKEAVKLFRDNFEIV